MGRAMSCSGRAGELRKRAVVPGTQLLAGIGWSPPNAGPSRQARETKKLRWCAPHLYHHAAAAGDQGLQEHPPHVCGAGSKGAGSSSRAWMASVRCGLEGAQPTQAM